MKVFFLSDLLAIEWIYFSWNKIQNLIDFYHLNYDASRWGWYHYNSDEMQFRSRARKAKAKENLWMESKLRFFFLRRTSYRSYNNFYFFLYINKLLNDNNLLTLVYFVIPFYRQSVMVISLLIMMVFFFTLLFFSKTMVKIYCPDRNNRSNAEYYWSKFRDAEYVEMKWLHRNLTKFVQRRFVELNLGFAKGINKKKIIAIANSVFGKSKKSKNFMHDHGMILGDDSGLSNLFAGKPQDNSSKYMYIRDHGFKSLSSKNLNFRDFYYSEKYKRYYEHSIEEFYLFEAILAYGYGRSKNLRNVYLNQAEVHTVDAYFIENYYNRYNFYNIVKDYFYMLEKNFYSFVLPHWLLHKDLFSYQLGKHKQYAPFNNKEEEEKFYLNNADPSSLDLACFWILFAPGIILGILTYRFGYFTVTVNWVPYLEHLFYVDSFFYKLDMVIPHFDYFEHTFEGGDSLHRYDFGLPTDRVWDYNNKHQRKFNKFWRQTSSIYPFRMVMRYQHNHGDGYFMEYLDVMIQRRRIANSVFIYNKFIDSFFYFDLSINNNTTFLSKLLINFAILLFLISFFNIILFKDVIIISNKLRYFRRTILLDLGRLNILISKILPALKKKNILNMEDVKYSVMYAIFLFLCFLCLVLKDLISSANVKFLVEILLLIIFLLILLLLFIYVIYQLIASGVSFFFGIGITNQEGLTEPFGEFTKLDNRLVLYVNNYKASPYYSLFGCDANVLIDGYFKSLSDEELAILFHKIIWDVGYQKTSIIIQNAFKEGLSCEAGRESLNLNFSEKTKSYRITTACGENLFDHNIMHLRSVNYNIKANLHEIISKKSGITRARLPLLCHESQDEIVNRVSKVLSAENKSKVVRIFVKDVFSEKDRNDLIVAYFKFLGPGKALQELSKICVMAGYFYGTIFIISVYIIIWYTME